MVDITALKVYISSSEKTRYMLKQLADIIDQKELEKVLKIEGPKKVVIMTGIFGRYITISIIHKGYPRTAKEAKKQTKCLTGNIKICSYPQNNKLIQQELNKAVKESKTILTYSYYIT